MTDYNFTGRINFSGKEFRDEFNGFSKSFPTWEEVSTPVRVEIINGHIIASDRELKPYDKKAIERQFKEFVERGKELLEKLNKI